jgi:diacylglycerol kinase family enzyme
MPHRTLRIFFIINPGSGIKETDWNQVITDYFVNLDHFIELYELPKDRDIQTIQRKIEDFEADRVVAVGGDGTVKLAAECILKKETILCIIPAGSANGLAKELKISDKPEAALDLVLTDHFLSIHVTKVNDELCIHLSDIGFNAYVVKTFERQKGRGMWGYIKASLKVLWRHPMMTVEIETNDVLEKMQCAMIVIANGTRYGSGALINPEGKLDDKLFEVVIVKKVSFRELFKMRFSHALYDPAKTEVFHTRNLKMYSTRRAHFQVDGEYLGRVTEVTASLIPEALNIIVPLPENDPSK